MKTLNEIKNGELLEFKDKLPDPPMILILKRKAIRLFPSGERVALYHSDKLDMDISIPYNTSKKTNDVGAVSEQTELDTLFETYTDLLKQHFSIGSIHTDHPELLKMKMRVTAKYGKEAQKYLHCAAEQFLNGNIAKAAREYSKFESKINENYEEILDKEYMFTEAAIHAIHHIAKTKTDGEVRFANGSAHKLSAKQAAHFMRMHSMLSPENKAAAEKHVSSPEGLQKVCDFAATNLK